MTPVQYGLLTVLDSRPGIDQATLAAELGIDRTNVANVLARLAARKLVVRKSDPGDRRVKVAYLTPAGRKIVRSLLANIVRAETRLLAPLALRDRRRFRDLLKRLVERNNEFGRTLLRPS